MNMRIKCLKATVVIAFMANGMLYAQGKEKVDEAVGRTWQIKNVLVLDGTGGVAKKTDLRISGKMIVAVGKLKTISGEKIIDGGGKMLVPGFIDTHSHLEGSFADNPAVLAAVNQGVTTIVVGQDGYASWMDSLEKRLIRSPVAVNVASYTGHTTLREKVLGENNLGRAATDGEIEEMQRLLAEEIGKGSLGLSTGLEYAGAYFSSYKEVLALARTASAAKGRYISHLRSEDIGLNAAIDEIIRIGKEARLPVQISHLKIALRDDWKTAPLLLAKLDSARKEGIDITADCYPYDFWRSTLKVLFPQTDYDNLGSAEFAVNHSFDPSESVIVAFKPEPSYKGMTLSEIAKKRGKTEALTLMELIAEADEYRRQNPDSSGIEGIMGKSMTDSDVVDLLNWAHTNICSDGADGGHPRGYGSFTRILGHYVREEKSMQLENAIHKMTALAARHMGIRDRGMIAPGYYADLVLFDPIVVKDNATIKSPKALSDGILRVWVNGEEVYRSGKATGKFPGIFIKK